MKRYNLNKALDIFQNETGFDFYSLLTDESTQEKYYSINKEKDFSEYIDENKIILKAIKEIESDYKE